MPRVTVKARLLNNATFEARENEQNGKMQFSALAVLEPGEENKIYAARDSAIKEKWGAKPPAKMMDYAVREGDDPDFENTFEKLFINAKSLRPPKAVKKLPDGSFERLHEDDDPQLCYPGVFCYLSVDVYAYDANKQTKSPPGVTSGYGGFCFWKHGENLGGSVNVGEAFGGDDIVSDEEELEYE